MKCIHHNTSNGYLMVRKGCHLWSIFKTLAIVQSSKAVPSQQFWNVHSRRFNCCIGMWWPTKRMITLPNCFIHYPEYAKQNKIYILSGNQTRDAYLVPFLGASWNFPLTLKKTSLQSQKFCNMCIHGQRIKLSVSSLNPGSLLDQ